MSLGLMERLAPPMLTPELENQLQNKRLVFLVGAPRSGTTWLQLLLSRSPSIVTAQETDLFNVFLQPLIVEWNRYRKTGEPVGLTEVMSREDISTVLRGVSGFVLARMSQRKPSATVILEKTPNHVQCWREILDLWPNAHFIHIIRDPRSVVASLRLAAKTWGPQWWGGSSRVSTICARWISDVSDGRQIRSATPNCQEVTFQELIADGPGVLLRLLTGIGVQTNLDECHRYVEECRIENLKEGKLENAPFDVAKIGKYRFRLGTTDSWRVELSKWEIALVERMAGPLMSDLGFKRVGSSAMSKLIGINLVVNDTARAIWRRLKSLVGRY